MGSFVLVMRFKKYLKENNVSKVIDWFIVLFLSNYRFFFGRFVIIPTTDNQINRVSKVSGS